MIIADLHIHSKYSRATSREGTPEYLDLWARKKGISLIGTGDFTHPAWRQELREKLIPAEDGLYRLREDACIQGESAASGCPPRFVLSGEISSIYKKDGKTRKVHNVILLPDLDAAETLSHKLEAIGNIHSDGRPILGLDSRDLLEITLEACPDAIFIPAHIWTPHFSLFGAFSGFQTIEECFGDLTPYIHALETGLSSDPPMNWRLSALDGYTLVSNSDAHSPSKLGREANLLDTELSYMGLSQAIQTGEGFAGTIEFFPEEGKYHYDGHRACKLCLSPGEAEQLDGKCPVCGKKLTIGVDHRVGQLADRPEGFRPKGARPFESLVPLPEVIGASTGASPAGVKVLAQYEGMLKELGPEFSILREVPLEDIRKAAGPCVAEGIHRLREGRVERSPGYDGEYGTIRLLSRNEIDQLNGQTSLFPGMASPAKPAAKSRIVQSRKKLEAAEEIVPDGNGPPNPSGWLPGSLNGEQLAAVTAEEPAVAVIAGPGTGKTKTLVSRIIWLMEECGVKPSEITAVTFTNKAAGEMRKRLESYFGKKGAVRSITIGTFHSICFGLLKAWNGGVTLAGEYEALDMAAETARTLGIKKSPRSLLQEISRRKNGGETEIPLELYEDYNRRLREAGVLDFDDLLLAVLSGWAEHASADAKQRRRFSYLLVDEFQDINPVQYQLLRTWGAAGKGLFAIGDPDQSIYGFRGSDAQCFARLREDLPALREIRLQKNYRSTPAILQCALSLISHNPDSGRSLVPQASSGPPVRLLTAESALSEGIFAAKEINRMVGGIDMLDAEGSILHGDSGQPRSFSEIALLYRTHRQAELLEMCLRKEGIPYVVAGRDDFLADEKVRGTICFFRFLLEPEDLLSLRTSLALLWECPADLCRGFASFWEKQGAAPEGAQPISERFSAAGRAYPGIHPIRQWLRLAEQFHLRIAKEKPRKLLEAWAAEMGLASHPPMERLLNSAVFQTDFPSFLQNLLLGQESDFQRSSGKLYTAGAVTLMTLHGSKGLEFPVVFLCGMQKGRIPLETEGHLTDFEEERRLLYVGMTRAGEELLLLSGPEPSPFLKELPRKLLHEERAGGKHPPAEGTQLRLY